MYAKKFNLILFLSIINYSFLTSMESGSSSEPTPKKDLRQQFLTAPKHSSSCSSLPASSENINKNFSKLQKTYSSSFDDLPDINDVSTDIRKLVRRGSAILLRKLSSSRLMDMKTEKTAQDILNQSFIKAIEHLDFAEVKLALDKGADINFQDNEGNTALMKIVSLLPKKKSFFSFKKKIQHSTTILIFELLIRSKADAHIKNKKGETVFDIAEKKGDQISKYVNLSLPDQKVEQAICMFKQMRLEDEERENKLKLARQEIEDRNFKRSIKKILYYKYYTHPKRLERTNSALF